MAGKVPSILEEIQKLVDKSAELDRTGRAVEADQLMEQIKDLGGSFVTKARKLTEEGLNADEGGHKEEAVRLYREAVGICLEAARSTDDRGMKRKFSKLAEEALERAESVKEQVEEDIRTKTNSFGIKDEGEKIKREVEAIATHYDQFRKKMEADDVAWKANETSNNKEARGGEEVARNKDKPGEYFKHIHPWNKLDKITCVHCKEGETVSTENKKSENVETSANAKKDDFSIERKKSMEKAKDKFEKNHLGKCNTHEANRKRTSTEEKDETDGKKAEDTLIRKKSLENTKNKLEKINFKGNINCKPENVDRKSTEKEETSRISLGEEISKDSLARKRSMKETKNKLESINLSPTRSFNVNYKPEKGGRRSAEKEESSRSSLGEELSQESLARRRSMKETRNQLEKINLSKTRSLNFPSRSNYDLLTNMARSDGPGDHVEADDAVPELPAIPQLQHLAKNRPKRNKKHAATKSMVLLEPPPLGEMDNIAAGLDNF